MLGLPAIGSTIAAFSITRIRTRLGAPRVAIGIGLLFTVALATIAAAPTLPVLAVGAILFGLGEGSTFPTLQDRLAGSVPDEVRGTAMATQVSSARTGQVIGPVLAGGLQAQLDYRTTYVVGSLFAAGAFLPLVRRAVRGPGGEGDAADLDAVEDARSSSLPSGPPDEG